MEAWFLGMEGLLAKAISEQDLTRAGVFDAVRRFGGLAGEGRGEPQTGGEGSLSVAACSTGKVRDQNLQWGSLATMEAMERIVNLLQTCDE